MVTTVAIQPLRVTTREGRREGRPSTARSCSRVRGWGLSSAGAAVPACDDAGAAAPACAPDDDAGPCVVPAVAGDAAPAGAWLPTCDDAEAPDEATEPLC